MPDTATRSVTTPAGWYGSPSQDTQHEVARSITSPCGWEASPSQDTQYEATRSITAPASPSELEGNQQEESKSNYSPLDGRVVHRRVNPSISLGLTGVVTQNSACWDISSQNQQSIL